MPVKQVDSAMLIDGAKGAERTLAVSSNLSMDLKSFTEYCKQPGSERLLLRLEAAGATPGAVF